MIKNGDTVKTPKGEGVVKSAIGGFHGTYYIVDINGQRFSFLDKEVKTID
jgi:hypothetical protein